MRQKLEDNKGKEEAEQTDHVLAKTIKSKLQSAIRFTDFLWYRHIFIGLHRQDLKDCKQLIWELQKKYKGLNQQKGELN